MNKEWQPIETAPKDFTVLILFERGDYESFDEIFIGYWKRHMWVHQEDDHRGAKPTHWMPLPAPPPRS